MQKLLLQILLFSTVEVTAAQTISPLLAHRTSETQVDSVFTNTFAAISQSIKSGKPLGPSESAFTYVVSFMSGISFDLQSYTGAPQLTEAKLAEFSNWYATYRNAITWRNLRRGLDLINSPLTDTTVAELKALRIN